MASILKEICCSQPRTALVAMALVAMLRLGSVSARLRGLQIMLTDDELVAIDNWRFERRMPTRAAAIRELLKRGLAAEGFVLADRDVKSRDFGVLSKQKSKQDNGAKRRNVSKT